MDEVSFDDADHEHPESESAEAHYVWQYITIILSGSKEMDARIASFFYENGIAFNVADSTSFITGPGTGAAEKGRRERAAPTQPAGGRRERAGPRPRALLHRY